MLRCGQAPVSVCPRGFSLVEMMVVIVILAILAAVGAPGMAEFINSQRVKNGATDLYASLVRARSEAIKRNSSVTMTPASGTDWAGGWSMTGSTTSGASETIDSHQAIPNITFSGPSSLTFNVEGRVANASAPSFSLSSGAAQRCITLDLSGRPAIKTGGC